MMRTGRRLGVDVGSVRIGVAVSDAGGMLATPVETVPRGKGDVARLATLAAEYDVIEIVLGLPVQLSGGEGIAADQVREFAAVLADAVLPCPVRLVDERLSTVVATRGMRDVGVSSRKGRPIVDQAAASVILQDALDAERLAGHPPGEIVSS